MEGKREWRAVMGKEKNKEKEEMEKKVVEKLTR